MTDTPITTPAGWYPAPDGSPAKWWWDGTRWIQPPAESRPNPATMAKLATATQVLLLVYGVVTIITLAIEVFGIGAATVFLDGDDAAVDLLGVYDQLTLAVSVLSIVSVLGTAVLWVLWQYRAAKLATIPLRRSPGWHVGSWFVPVIALWFPYQNISDLWQAAGRTRPSWQIVWWLLWVVSNALVQQSSRMYTDAVDLEQLRVSMWLGAAGEILVLAAVPFAWLIVRGITQGLLQRSSAPAQTVSTELS